MSFVFLECDWFRERGCISSFECCKDCHADGGHKRIFVSPFKEDGINTDWQLCIQGIVCCEMYDAVRALPREFWVHQAELHNVKRDDGRGYIYPSSPERNTERSISSGNATTTKKRPIKRQPVRRKSDQELEEEGGFAAWNR